MRASYQLWYLGFATLVTVCSTSPVPESEDTILKHASNSTPTTTSKFQLADLDSSEFENDTDIYDERQKGIDNYRITINGVRFLVAPASSMLAALSLADFKKDSNGQNKPVLNFHDFTKLKSYLPKFLKRLRANQKKHHKPIGTEEVETVKQPEIGEI